MEMLQRTMAERIKALRLSAGLTQEQLAEKAGIGPEHLSRLERGVTVPSLEAVVDLAVALGVEPVDVLGRLKGDATSELADRIAAAISRLNGEDAAFLEAQILDWVSHLHRRD